MTIQRSKTCNNIYVGIVIYVDRIFKIITLDLQVENRVTRTTYIFKGTKHTYKHNFSYKCKHI